MAHFVEHVTFLGSRKRENLLGTGCRSNAYTDFQHTVFHVHLPLSHGTTGRPMLPQVSAALFAREPVSKSRCRTLKPHAAPGLCCILDEELFLRKTCGIA